MNFDAKIPSSDVEFGFNVMQNFYSSPLSEVMLIVASEILKAYHDAIFDYVDCGAFTAGAWHNVEIAMNWAGTFDIKIDGAPTVCTGLEMYWGDGYPFGYIQVIESSDADFGGTAQFDNFRGTLAAP